MADDIRHGDVVETCVFVCNERRPVQFGKVVGVHSGYCEVDVGSICGCRPIVNSEVTWGLRKVGDDELREFMERIGK